jgi:hypothetical protein
MYWVFKSDGESAVASLVMTALFTLLLLKLLEVLLAVVAFLHLLLVESLEGVFEVQLQFLELVAELDLASLEVDLVLVI